MTQKDATIQRHRVPRAPVIGLAFAIVLLVASTVIPAVTGWKVFVSTPPLHAEFDPRSGLGTIPAVVLAVLAVLFAARLAARARWWALLIGVTVASAAWMISLALTDGLAGIGAILDTSYEYLNTARSVTDVGATLRDYIAHIPFDSVDHWPVHIAGHPPGALLFFVVLVHLGLGSGLAAGFAVIAVAATTPAAVLITLRRLGAEAEARAAAPFLVFGSAAIWMAVSADAMFGAIAAWGLCALAASATAKRFGWMLGFSLLSGLLLGYCVMLSYGLPLLGVLAVAILFLGRTWRPLVGAVAAALAVVLTFAANGFAWWEAYPVLSKRYWDGIASSRPYEYWVWGDLAALTVSAGPIVGASIAAAIGRVRTIATPGVRAVAVLVCAASVTVALADLSAMSKAEVERIWLPFVPWLLIGTALLPAAWRRPALALQVAFALVVQHLLSTGW
jgi:hypothetical protein